MILAVINRELAVLDLKLMEKNPEYDSLNFDQLADKIRYLETRNQSSDNNILQANPSSSRSSKVRIYLANTFSR